MPKYDDFNLDIQKLNIKDEDIVVEARAPRASCLTSTPRRPCCMRD